MKRDIQNSDVGTKKPVPKIQNSEQDYNSDSDNDSDAAEDQPKRSIVCFCTCCGLVSCTDYNTKNVIKKQNKNLIKINVLKLMIILIQSN